MSFSGLIIRVMLAPSNEFESVYFSFIFWEKLCRNWNYFFLKCLVEFASEAIWAWDFLWLEGFNNTFNFVNRYRDIQVTISS